MASSPVDICNSALAKVGSDRITSLSEDSAAARACNGQYDNKRKALLRSHPWNFATLRIEIGLLATEPVFEFDSAFGVPADCLRVLDIEDNYIPWRIEGRTLVTNNTECKIKYITDLTDTSKFDPHFEEALATDLAADICFLLSKNATLSKELKIEAKEKIAQARSFNAQESSGAVIDAGTFRDVRF